MNVSWITLILLVLLFRMPVAGEASDESRADFEWFSGLGYPEVKDAKWAQIWTGFAWREGNGPVHVDTTYGFVIEDEKDHFRVLMPDLTRRYFKRTEKARSESTWVGYEERPFLEMAREILRRAQDLKNLESRRFGRVLDQRATTFFTAHTCWKRGETALAGELYEAAKRLPIVVSFDGEQPDPKSTMRQLLEIQLGRAAIWTATLQFGDNYEDGEGAPLRPRTELLDTFRRIVKNYPASPYQASAKQTVATLEMMVREDAGHPVISADALAKLPEDQQVAEWVFRLRDQNGHHYDDPGSCNIFTDSTAGKDVSPAHQLVRIGYKAVPQLIDALGDERLTRSVECHRSFTFSHRVLTIGDCAMLILQRITGEPFYQWKRADKMSHEEETAAKQELPKQWWADFQQKGGVGLLVDAISSGEKSPDQLIGKLRVMAPEAVEAAILRGAANAKGGMISAFIQPVGSLATKAADDQLLAWCDGSLPLSLRLSACIQLFNQDHPNALPMILREWKRYPASKSEENWDDFENLVKLLIASGDPVAMGALVANWEKRPDSERFEIVEKLGAGLRPQPEDWWTPKIKNRPPSAGAKDIAIRLLSQALEDEVTGIGINVNHNVFRFQNPKIGDFALYGLNQIAPSEHAFSLQAGKRQREVERITAANKWRQAHGQEALPFPPPAGPALGENEALKITTVEIGPPRNPADTALTDKITALKGTLFAANTIPQLLIWFANHECQGVRGLRVEAFRESDLTGVTLKASVVAGNYPPREKSWEYHSGGSVGTRNLGISGGSGKGDSIRQEKTWKHFFDELTEALETTPTTPFSVTAGLVGQL